MLKPYEMFKTGELNAFGLYVQKEIEIDNFKDKMKHMAGNGWSLIDAIEDMLKKQYIYPYDLDSQMIEWLEKEFSMKFSEDEIDF